MAHWKLLGAGSVLGLLLSTTAQADVTADQVWKSWQDFSTSMGQTMVAGSEEMAGDTLTISDLTMTAEMKDGTFEGSIESVQFKELGDGTVEVTMSPDYPVTITTTAEGEDPVEVGITVKQAGLKLIVSGTEAEMAHAFTADEVSVVLDKVSGMPEGATAAATIALKAMAGSYMVTDGDPMQITSDLTAAGLTVDVAATDPTTSSDFTLTAAMEAIKSASTTLLPAQINMEDMGAALAAGFSTKGGFGYGKTTYKLDFKDATSSGNATGTNETGAVDIAMDADALSYNVSSTGTDITLMSSDMPFPEVNAKMAELGLGLTMPVAVSQEPQDFSFLTKIIGLSVSDEIWGMFDPGAVLPRDPATVILDLSGKANWLIDIFKQDPAAPADMPGQLHALTLKQLEVAFGGADLTGTGDFTFDNSDLVTFDGMPKPTGKLDAKLVGGNGLIDKLVQMGLLPEDQAMGGRMMMGMFAKMVDGQEDTMTSTIEMKADGSIFANGQQIQ